VLRTTDLFNWQVMDDVGPVAKFETVRYTDANLQPDTRYCYTVESYNSEGARQSPFKCTYTVDGHDIGVWRLQLRVKVANLADAGADHPLRVQMANDGEHLPVATFLDYGQDDFERGSDFTFDLNIESIRELSEITDLTIVNHRNEQDVLLIEAFSLLVNEHEPFSRYFGMTPTSALRLGLSGAYRVEHDELRSNPSWGAFVTASLNDPAFNLPPISVADNGQFQVRGEIDPGSDFKEFHLQRRLRSVERPHLDGRAENLRAVDRLVRAGLHHSAGDPAVL
jgi:hypothetical protein